MTLPQFPDPQFATSFGGSPTERELRSDNNDAIGFPALSEFARNLLDESPGDVYREITTAVDRVIVDVALRYTKGNQLHAANLLGISRTTLRAKLRSLGLSVEKQLAWDEAASGGRLRPLIPPPEDSADRKPTDDQNRREAL